MTASPQELFLAALAESIRRELAAMTTDLDPVGEALAYAIALRRLHSAFDDEEARS